MVVVGALLLFFVQVQMGSIRTLTSANAGTQRTVYSAMLISFVVVVRICIWVVALFPFLATIKMGRFLTILNAYAETQVMLEFARVIVFALVARLTMWVC